MKKFRWVFILFIVIGVFVVFALIYNPSISVGYDEGLIRNDAKEYPFQGRVGILLKKTRYKIKDKVTGFFSYGYYEKEELTDFHIMIYIEDEDKGMECLFESDIDNFYSDEYQVIKPSLIGGDLKYAKYENLEIDFSSYTNGVLVIKLTALDKNYQNLEISKQVSYEVKGDKVTFKK